MRDDIGLCRDPACWNYGRLLDDDCPPDHAQSPNGPFRDGKVWVLSEKCSTCIFRPGNKMHLRPGLRDNMVQSCIDDNTVIPCHETLDGPRSVCRGLWDTHRADIMILRLGRAMDIIEFDELPEEH